MDSVYFAPDMTRFAAQADSWLKENGVFIIGYQEGDLAAKTKNSETTLIARALRDNGMTYSVTDITRNSYDMLVKKRETVKKYKKAFYDENIGEWYEIILRQTDCASASFDDFEKNNARYIYAARKSAR